MVLALAAIAAAIFIGAGVSENPNSAGRIGAHCLAASPGKDRSYCWYDTLERVLREHGVAAAFSALAVLYAQNPDVENICHELTHRIGQAAYENFAANRNFDVTPKMAFCNFGFYHGFMERLLAESGDAAQARSFCEYVDRALGALTQGASGQCFHGIGHGMVNGHEAGLWGNARAMISRALPLCEEVSDTPGRRRRCAAGVYNGIFEFHLRGEYGLHMDQIDAADPLALCRGAPKDYRVACYADAYWVVAHIAKRDFSKITATLSQIPDPAVAAKTVWYFASFNMDQRLGANDHDRDIAICRGLAAHLRLPCIQGLGTGFLLYGPPEYEYVGAIRFCGAEILHADERIACFENILGRIRDSYSPVKVSQICAGVDASYRKFCRE